MRTLFRASLFLNVKTGTFSDAFLDRLFDLVEETRDLADETLNYNNFGEEVKESLPTATRHAVIENKARERYYVSRRYSFGLSVFFASSCLDHAQTWS